MRRHSFQRTSLVFGSLAAATVLTAKAAMAHPGHGGHSLTDGLAHPLFGIDHLLAMVTVGLLAMKYSGRSRWALPGGFLLAVATGSLLGLGNTAVGTLEYGVLASVFILGGLVALPMNLPFASVCGLTVLFGALHGYVHTAELASGASAATYIAGFLMMSATLQLTGMSAGLALERVGERRTALQMSGWAVIGASLMLACGLL